MNSGEQLKIAGKKILLVGAWSNKNLGDELILLGNIKILLAQGKQIYISAYNISWLKGFLSQFVDISQLKFLKEIPKGFKSFFRFISDKHNRTLKTYRDMDSVIVGGGEILTEETTGSYINCLISIFPCLNKHTQIYLMGGVQIPQKSLNKKLFGYLIKKVSYVYARDLESVYELKQYGFDNAKFFMDTSFFAYDRANINKGTPDRRKYIIVNVNKSGEQFLPEIIHDVQYYLQQGYRVLYVAMSKARSDTYSDIYYYKKIKFACKKDEKFDILDREKDFDQFVKTIAGAEIVISSRLHLFLISSFLGTRTKIYPYQKKIFKMQELLRDIGGIIKNEYSTKNLQ